MKLYLKIIVNILVLNSCNINDKKVKVFDKSKVKTERKQEIKYSINDVLNTYNYEMFKDINPFMISGIDKIEKEDVNSNEYFYIIYESIGNINLLRIDNKEGGTKTNKIEFKKTGTGFLSKILDVRYDTPPYYYQSLHTKNKIYLFTVADMDFNETNTTHDIIQEILVIDKSKAKRYDTSHIGIHYSLINNWIKEDNKLEIFLSELKVFEETSFEKELYEKNTFEHLFLNQWQ